MNRLSMERRVLILRCLTDGCSMRATARITGHARNTIAKLLAEVGEACQRYHERVMKNLHCAYLQVDEMWTFCGCKEKSLKMGKEGEGSVWAWLALDAETKLVPFWHLGRRSTRDAYTFLDDLSDRITDVTQISTDGYQSYGETIAVAFGSQVAYGQLVKQYHNMRCVGSVRKSLWGRPDEALISTSFIERQNLTMRMNMRRFTRKTNGFSKSLRSLKHAVALHFMHYNFVRVHQTLATVPAVAAGLTAAPWSLEKVVGLI